MQVNCEMELNLKIPCIQ